MIYDISIAGKERRLDLRCEDGRWRSKLDGEEIQLDAVLMRPDVLSILVGGKSYQVKRECIAGQTRLWLGTEPFSVEVRDPRSWRGRQKKATDDHGPQKLVALMPGKVIRLLIKENIEVEAGQGVLVVEAMKMQNEIKSPKKGRIAKMMAAEGDRVNAGDVLAIVD